MQTYPQTPLHFGGQQVPSHGRLLNASLEHQLEHLHLALAGVLGAPLAWQETLRC
jgi:hypothetical protein